MLKQQKNVTALYCRYSKDEDYHGGDSMSIRNQKGMLENYAKENGFLSTEFYIDDDLTLRNILNFLTHKIIQSILPTNL